MAIYIPLHQPICSYILSIKYSIIINIRLVLITYYLDGLSSLNLKQIHQVVLFSFDHLLILFVMVNNSDTPQTLL